MKPKSEPEITPPMRSVRSGGRVLLAYGGLVVARMENNSVAAADHIARCVNTHDGLLKALETLTDRVDPGVRGRDLSIGSLVNALRSARAAIAKTRGQQ